MMIAEEKQFTEAGALAIYVNMLFAEGCTDLSVTVIAKSWYLIAYKRNLP